MRFKKGLGINNQVMSILKEMSFGIYKLKSIKNKYKNSQNVTKT